VTSPSSEASPDRLTSAPALSIWIGWSVGSVSRAAGLVSCA